MSTSFNLNLQLLEACENGDVAEVEKLLALGANVNSKDKNYFMYHRTPLHPAAKNGHNVMVEVLVKAGADHSAVDDYHRTPLHWAAKNGHNVTVEVLLKAGADLSAVDYYHWTPLHWATENGHDVTVEVLVKAGADHSAVDDKHRTPLHWAAKNGHNVTVEVLLNAGADLSAVDNSHRTPLHWAAENRHNVTVEVLVKAGADLSAVDNYHRTPLHWAAENRHNVTVEVLLKAGADHSAVDDEGNTPLHLAVMYGRKSTMEVLIRYGASMNTRNKDGVLFGKTPLDLMKEWDSENLKSVKIFATEEKRRQKDAVALFMKQCKENGSIECLFIKCILTGLPGVGKTSFLRRIEKKMTPSKEDGKEVEVIPSTGFEAPLTVNIAEDSTSMTTAAIASGHWMPTDDLHDQGSMLMSMVKYQYGTRSSSDTSNGQTKKHFASSGTTALSKVSPIMVADNLPDIESSKKAAKKELSTARKFVDKAVRRCPTADKVENVDTLTTVYFLDTGGQPEFHELLPPLLHGSAFHLIFFNAFQDLFKPVEVIYRHKDKGTSSVKYKSSSSSIETIHQLLVSFFSISKKEKHQSVAALFGSHIDMLSSDNEKRLEELRKVSTLLEQAFRDTSLYDRDFLLIPGFEKCPSFFQPIDNKTSSEEELEKIQRFLSENIQRQFSPVTLPVTWGIFHLSLREKYEKSPGVCSMKECIDLAEECHIPAEHVPHVLQFFHFNLGTILYYSEISALRYYVIVNPNVLFHGISRLVTYSFIGSGEHQDVAHTLRVSGEIPASILRLNEPLSADSPLTNQCIVELLVHFKLLHISSESTFFMPCLLLPDPDVISSLISLDTLSISPPPLLILFEDGFVPIGLFSGLVNELSQKWNLDKEGRFRNRVRFIAPPGYVELRQCLKYIEVRAVNVESFCVSIREKMVQCLENVIEVQPHLVETKYKIGFYCPGSLSSYLHPCEYSSEFAEALICAKTPRCFDSKLLPPQYHPWFKTGLEKESTESSATSKEIEAIDLSCISDSLLTEVALLPALSECYEVVEWKVLGVALGVCKADLERIQRDEPSELLRQMEMLSKWISSDNATWRGLAGALLRPPLKAESVAKSIANKHTT